MYFHDAWGLMGTDAPAQNCKPYPSDVSDEEWSLVVSYLTFMTEAAPQRDHSLREPFDALRYMIRYGLRGAPCRMIF